MTITYSDFQKTVNENAGEVLVTSGGRAMFRLEKSSDGVRFTPLSTGKSRPLNAEAVQRYLVVFNKTQSTTTSDYTDKMRNASYVLAVVRLWLGQQEAKAPSPEEPIDDAELDPSFSAEEAKQRLRSHWARERSRELVRMAKALFQANHDGRLFCQVCGFDFGVAYGQKDFIEAHHRVPLRDLQPGHLTKISDLDMVCANCHRMLHRGKRWPTLNELKQQFEALKTQHLSK